MTDPLPVDFLSLTQEIETSLNLILTIYTIFSLELCILSVNELPNQSKTKNETKNPLFSLSRSERKRIFWKELFRNENGRRRRPRRRQLRPQQQRQRDTLLQHRLMIWFSAQPTDSVYFCAMRTFRSRKCQFKFRPGEHRFSSSFFSLHRKETEKGRRMIWYESVRVVTVLLKCFSAIRNFLDKHFSPACVFRRLFSVAQT